MKIWIKLKPYAPLIRLGGNFGVSFFGSLGSFEYITDLPDAKLVLGAFLAAVITTSLALSYEARRYQLGRN